MTANDILYLTLRRVFAGSGRAYIYILCSKESRVLYVGQTNDSGGVCGRLGDHLARRGTFRKRLDDAAVFLEQVRDLEVWAFALPEAAEYISKDETYREGVEWRVQTYLQRVRSEWTPRFSVVSNITAPVTVEYPETITLADWITRELEILYHTASNS